MTLKVFIAFVDVIVAFQSLFFSVFLLTFKKHKNFGNYFFAGFLFLTGIHFINLTFFHVLTSFYSISVSAICGTLYGPLLYYYLAFQLRKKVFPIHVLPALLHLLPLICMAVALVVVEKDDSFAWVQIPTYLLLFFYLSVCNMWLYENSKRSLINDAIKSWLRFLYGMFLVFIVVYTFTGIMEQTLNRNFYITLQLTNVIFHAFFINALLFLTLKYPDIISGKEYLKNRLAQTINGKYAYSNLGDQEAQRILTKLERAMAIDEIYKIPDLTLEKIGEKLQEESKYISESINKFAGKNFKEYINEIRVDEAAAMFSNHEYLDWRINEVMYAVGFRSKSSFNTNFKKYTGRTPKEHRDKYCLRYN